MEHEIFSIWDDWVHDPREVATRFATTYWEGWPRRVEKFNPQDCSFMVEEGTRYYRVVHMPSKYKNEVGKFIVTPCD